MLIFYDKVDKERNKTIKKINDINQILKHTFDSFVLNSDGIVYQSLPKIKFGYHISNTKLHEYLCVPEGKLIKFSSSAIFTYIKERKKEIRGFGVAEDIAHFITDKGERLIIGKLLTNKESDEILRKALSFMTIYNNAKNISELDEDDIDMLVSKSVLTKECGEYKMVLTHKVLPQIKKVKNIPILINDAGTSDHTFVGIFEIKHDVATTIHFYKFLKF